MYNYYFIPVTVGHYQVFQDSHSKSGSFLIFLLPAEKVDEAVVDDEENWEDSRVLGVQAELEELGKQGETDFDDVRARAL